MKTIRSYRLWIFPINVPRLAWLITIATLIAIDAHTNHAVYRAIGHYLTSLPAVR